MEKSENVAVKRIYFYSFQRFIESNFYTYFRLQFDPNIMDYSVRTFSTNIGNEIKSYVFILNNIYFKELLIYFTCSAQF